jgi:hypothetical protein
MPSPGKRQRLAADALARERERNVQCARAFIRARRSLNTDSFANP